MRRKLLSILALLLTVTQGAWAEETEGPWTYESFRSGTCGINDNLHIPYTGLNNTHWGNAPTLFNTSDGIGFRQEGTSSGNSKDGIYSTYYHSESVPAYTRKVLTWKYYVRSYCSPHWQRVTLYAHDNMADLKNMAVDFTVTLGDYSGSDYLIASFYNTSGLQTSELQTTYFSFDNRNGSESQTKTWNLLMTYVIENGVLRDFVLVSTNPSLHRRTVLQS